MSTYVTDTGCKVLLPITGVRVPVSWTGRCQEGYANGVGILTYRVETTYGLPRWHVKSLRSDGIATGIGWTVTDLPLRDAPSKTFDLGLGIYKNGERITKITLELSDSLDQSLLKADGMIKVSLGLGLPSMTADVLRNDIRQWNQNPSQFTGGSSSSSGATSTTTDDPKVFGRAVFGR